MNSLQEVVKHHEKIIFLTYLTIEPSHQSIIDFCEQYNTYVGTHTKNPLWLIGSKIKTLQQTEVPSNITLVKDIPSFLEQLKNLKKG